MKRALFFALSLSLSLLVGYSLSEAQSRRKGSGKIRESPPSESTAPPTAQPEGRQPAQKGEIVETLGALETKASAAEKNNNWWEASRYYREASNAARLSGQLQKAVGYGQKAFEMGEKVAGPGPGSSLQAQATLRLAFALRELGQRQKATKWLQKGIEIAKQVPPGPFKEAVEANLSRKGFGDGQSKPGGSGL